MQMGVAGVRRSPPGLWHHLDFLVAFRVVVLSFPLQSFALNGVGMFNYHLGDYLVGVFRRMDGVGQPQVPIFFFLEGGTIH